MYNRSLIPAIYFWRDQAGKEVDALIDYKGKTIPVEIKAGMTINTSFFENLLYWNKLAHALPEDNVIVYGGDESQTRSNGRVYSWRAINDVITW